MRSVFVFVGCFVLGGAISATGVLNGVSNFWMGAVLGACLLAFFTLFPHPSAAPLPFEECKRQVKAAVRKTIDKIDPPLVGEDYAEACRQLYRAVAQGRDSVTLRVAGRTHEVTININ